MYRSRTFHNTQTKQRFFSDIISYSRFFLREYDGFPFFSFALLLLFNLYIGSGNKKWRRYASYMHAYLHMKIFTIICYGIMHLCNYLENLLNTQQLCKHFKKRLNLLYKINKKYSNTTLGKFTTIATSHRHVENYQNFRFDNVFKACLFLIYFYVISANDHVILSSVLW